MNAPVTRRSDVVFRQLDDEWVVYDPTADKIHTLNLTAALVWSHLVGDLDAEGVARVVSEAFTDPAPFDDVRRDVDAAIKRFREEGLLA